MSIMPRRPATQMRKHCFVWCGKTAAEGCECSQQVRQRMNDLLAPFADGNSVGGVVGEKPTVDEIEPDVGSSF